ncbi:ATP synthase subunit I [Cellulomonas sp. RIT-PI-Y]|uniref:ATP synthase subunit I n=1 Tax=Cellulomonas sp. RIT-PI-Y TaxID=3035297 RepID=UPI0021DA25FC|nr:ATP synthase subunit I [Cellulomonas sp. RIT-PI-Y]
MVDERDVPESEEPELPTEAPELSTEAPELPTEEQLERVAEDATVRRAPKIGAFITAGALLGLVIGFLLAVLFARADEATLAADAGQAFISAFEGEGAIRFLSAVAGGCLGALLGAAAAVWADHRSRRR